MSIFLRRHSDGDLRQRVEEVESAHTALARAHEAHRAELSETVELLVRLLAPHWIPEFIDRAKASGWIVVVTPSHIVFSRPEGIEHDYPIPLPLPDTVELERRRRELHGRICFFEQRAA